MTPDPKELLQKARRAIVQVGRVVTGRQIGGRNLTVFPDDVFVTSYPRSGNTWLRFLIGNLAYQEEPVSFANIEGRIPAFMKEAGFAIAEEVAHRNTLIGSMAYYRAE